MLPKAGYGECWSSHDSPTCLGSRRAEPSEHVPEAAVITHPASILFELHASPEIRDGERPARVAVLDACTLCARTSAGSQKYC